MEGVDTRGVGKDRPEVYGQFGKWVYGLRAMAHTLRSDTYRNKPLEVITNTYSRTDRGTDKGSYSSNVASLSGGLLNIGQTVDTHNDEELRALMNSMITNEVGHNMAPQEVIINEAIRLSKQNMPNSELYNQMFPLEP